MARQREVHLSRFELEIMEILWTLGESSVREIQEAIEESRRPAYTTVQTILSRLEEKKVIVLDEWAADQDPHYRRVFYEELLPELRAQDKIVICVTHDDRWFHLADRTYRMDEGRLHPTAPPARTGGPT